MAHQPRDDETPLLAKPDAAALATAPAARRNKYPFFCAVLASMTSVLTGYNVAVMSGAQIFMAEDLGISDAQVEVLLGVINIYSLAGGVDLRPPQPAPHHRARQRLLPRRPARHGAGGRVRRAHGGPLRRRRRFRIFINTGVMLSYVSNLAFSGLPAHLSWRVMFAAGVVPTVFLAAGVLTMPESPRWLAMKGRVAEAKAVLDRTSDTLAEAEQRLLEIEAVVSSGGRSGGGAWKEVATKAGVRRVLAIVLTLQFFQQSSGIDSVVLYGPRVLAMAGVTSNTLLLSLNVLFGVAKAGSILIAMALADRVGRRPLLLASTGGMAASLLVLGSLLAAFAGARDDAAVAAASVAAVVAFVVAFSVGLGPLAWVYSSEILPLRLRGQGAGLGTAMNRVMSGVVTMTFISLYQAITMAGAFYLYAAVAAASFVFVYACLPETRGRSLEDMEELFHTK
ncbi:polyol transporter 5-like [Panicum miliaceum]|uniref:Polyol transporter 5-like n=1 Tax=Panicum miliaceum TaxID=4540 RepID=A0A3L6T2Q8_PANMI|nr:polyol transporter 5-like [Panicum miliaceum]